MAYGRPTDDENREQRNDKRHGNDKQHSNHHEPLQ
jgi:hypothetical protein